MIHPESVIDVAIKNYNEELYVKLTDMENQAYLDNDISKYKPLWVEYSDSWMSYIRGISLSESLCLGFVSSFYSYCMVQVGFNGSSGSDFANDAASGIFNGNGLIAEVLSRPDNYFDDLVIPLPPMPPATGPAEDPYSPKMNQDFAKLGTAVDNDKKKFEGLVNGKYPTVVGKYQMTVLFGDPTIPEVTLSKQEMWDLIFDELGWYDFFQSIGQAGVVPPRP